MHKPQAPFPWFGGKSRAAPEIWKRFGDIRNYVEPFFGSGAVLLGRPGDNYGIETINDLDGYVSNFWRAVQRAPDDVAKWADNPVNENDLHARHVWLLQFKSELQPRLEADPDYFDARVAGYWVWGQSCWIGSGWCSGKGPWSVDGGKLILGDSGQGVNRQLPHLGDSGQGVNRQLPHLGDLFGALSERLRRVRVCSGDWSRVCGPSVTFKHGMTGVLLDPPYADTADRDPGCYSVDSLTVAHDVRAWAIEAGKRDDMRIALCGYEGEHNMPSDWSVFEWHTPGGFASQGDGSNQNKYKERIWFSPACNNDQGQGSLF